MWPSFLCSARLAGDSSSPSLFAIQLHGIYSIPTPGRAAVVCDMSTDILAPMTPSSADKMDEAVDNYLRVRFGRSYCAR